jgi:hypothetical protein
MQASAALKITVSYILNCSGQSVYNILLWFGSDIVVSASRWPHSHMCVCAYVVDHSDVHESCVGHNILQARPDQSETNSVCSLPKYNINSVRSHMPATHSLARVSTLIHVYMFIPLQSRMGLLQKHDST